MIKKFNQNTIEKINYYVYLLEDPRTNQIFYIWKGKGNRVFSHLKWAIKIDKETNKIKIIKDILKTGKIPRHKIIRYWLNENEAFEVESALIDFFGINNLSNIVSWHYSKERWITDITELKIKYESKKISIDVDVLLRNINKLYYFWISESELYEATRKSWKIDINKAKKYKYVLSAYKWIIREVYEVNQWEKLENRYWFKWEIANQIIRDKYLHTDVSEYYKEWSQNPIKYLNKKST